MYGRKTADSDLSPIVDAPSESSVDQARWILMPLFGLWILFSVAGVIFS